MADFDLGALAGYLQPNEEDKKRALQASLMSAGFGMLANNSGHYGALGPALGAGGLNGMQQYQHTLDQLPKQRLQGLGAAVQMQKLQQSMQAQKAFSNMYGPQAGPPSGSSPGSSPLATGLPTATPTANAPGLAGNGPSLEQIGQLTAIDPERGKAALELWKAQNPGMQVNNGYAYNPRTVQPGFLPQMNVTPQGQAVTTQIGPDGQPVVTVPKGAQEAFGAFQDIEQRTKANYGPPVSVPQPDGTVKMMTPAQFASQTGTPSPPAQPMPQPSAAPKPSAAPAKDGQVLQLVAKDEATAQKWLKNYEAMGVPVNVSVKKMTADEWNQRQPKQPVRTSDVIGGITAGQTTEQKINNETRTAAKKEEATVVAKSYGEQFSTIQKSGFDAGSKIAKFDRMEQLLQGIDTGKLTPMSSSVMQTANSLGLKIDPKWNNIQAAEALSNEMALELRNPSGGAGMPGAMSDADRQYLTNMAPGISKTPEGRRLIINTGRQLAQRDKDVAQLARDYRKEHGQMDEGFGDVLANFARENPLFTQPATAQTASTGKVLQWKDLK